MTKAEFIERWGKWTLADLGDHFLQMEKGYEERGRRLEVLVKYLIDAYSYETEGPLHDAVAISAAWFNPDGTAK